MIDFRTDMILLEPSFLSKIADFARGHRLFLLITEGVILLLIIVITVILIMGNKEGNDNVSPEAGPGKRGKGRRAGDDNYEGDYGQPAGNKGYGNGNYGQGSGYEGAGWDGYVPDSGSRPFREEGYGSGPANWPFDNEDYGKEDYGRDNGFNSSLSADRDGTYSGNEWKNEPISYGQDGSLSLNKDDYEDKTWKADSNKYGFHDVILTDLKHANVVYRKALEEEVIIGRSPSCSIALANEKSVSSRHCVISDRSGRFFIADLNSTNGTRVNGNRISETVELMGGERLSLGRAEYTVTFR